MLCGATHCEYLYLADDDHTGLQTCGSSLGLLFVLRMGTFGMHPKVIGVFHFPAQSLCGRLERSSPGKQNTRHAFSLEQAD